ncbi:MAG: hypothetical protein NC094_03655 [Bacteroidales bacterium]|nr:hypothetical protein [Lachnoclostridium sp.]MCM1383854.1 hypothetical protein [Lachnoclostridium sp.]MCM1464493.1 hypothetical protein [Bacteroidales bacterium]
MDFNRKIMHPLPFYMTYPGYLAPSQESAALQDLEYLQQAYPREVRQYQRKIAEILDKLDYEGSMIYDEYPDCYSLQRLADTIIRILQQEEADKGEEVSDSEEWKSVKNIVQVLLCNEVYKRRHGGRRFGKF